MTINDKSIRLTALELSHKILGQEASRLDKLFAVSSKIEKYLNGEVRSITYDPGIIIQKHKRDQTVFLNVEQNLILDSLSRIEDRNILFVNHKRGVGSTTAVLSYLLWHVMNTNDVQVTITGSNNSSSTKLLREVQNIYNTVSTELITDKSPILGHSDIVFDTSRISMVVPHVGAFTGRKVNLAYFDNAHYISYSNLNEILLQLQFTLQMFNTRIVISCEANSDGPLNDILTNPSKYNFNIIDI